MSVVEIRGSEGRYGIGWKHTADIGTVVAVSVVGLLRTDVVHLVDGAALGAALDRAVARHGQPVDDVRVGGAASATDVLLVTEGANDNRLLHRSCVFRLSIQMSWRVV